MNDASTTTFHAPVATAANPMATDEDAPVLFLHGVSRTYSQGSAALEVLKNAELALWPGQSVALVAPSGAGKSTLLHVAGLLEHPDAGEVYMPAPQTGSPMTYMLGGKQYIVLAIGGPNFPAEFIAYKLQN